MTFGMSVPKKAEVEADHALSENSNQRQSFPQAQASLHVSKATKTSPKGVHN